jgi:Immunoglobulin-like domain of bacterial spore germination
MNSDDLENRLREGLHREAERIHPRERRTEILAMIHDETQVVEPGRRWFIPAAAAMSVALIGAIVWGVSNGGADQQARPAATSTSETDQSSNSAVPVPNPSPASPDAAAAGATTQVALPAYFVGSSSATGERFGLYREFVRTAVPRGATPAQKAKAAVAVAMNAQPFTNLEPYVQPWSGTTVKGVVIAPTLITITLSGPGPSGFTADQTRLAVQQLVWTAQAAIGKGAIPVKFVLGNGATKLFGTHPTARTYNRPAQDLLYQDLAPIWIVSPARAQVLPAGAPVVSKGESCAFEATTQWQLKKGATVVKSGFATASSGCPARGTWQVNLGRLAAGGYTFRMFEESMEGAGKVTAETEKPFTVK